jgi:RNA polymerase sigma factor (sigma-70 family)
MERPSAPRVAESDRWAALIRSIKLGDDAGLVALYIALDHIYPFYFRRHLGSEIAQDAIHDLFLLTVEAVRRGGPEEPALFMAYVRGIARHQIKSHLKAKIQRRAKECALDPVHEPVDGRILPDEVLRQREREGFIRSCMDEIGPQHREILARFYLRGETREQILVGMNLSPDQYRLLKWRATSAVRKIGQRRLGQLRLSEFANARRKERYT